MEKLRSRRLQGSFNFFSHFVIAYYLNGSCNRISHQIKCVDKFQDFGFFNVICIKLNIEAKSGNKTSILKWHQLNIPAALYLSNYTVLFRELTVNICITVDLNLHYYQKKALS